MKGLNTGHLLGNLSNVAFALVNIGLCEYPKTIAQLQ